MSEIRHSEYSTKLYSIFRGLTKKFGNGIESHNGVDRSTTIFEVDIGDEAAYRIIAFINKGGGPFMREDNPASVSYYPRAYNIGGRFVIEIPEGTEDICMANLEKNKSAISDILKQADNNEFLAYHLSKRRKQTREL